MGRCVCVCVCPCVPLGFAFNPSESRPRKMDFTPTIWGNDPCFQGILRVQVPTPKRNPQMSVSFFRVPLLGWFLIGNRQDYQNYQKEGNHQEFGKP